MNMTVLWIVAAVVFLIAEIATVGMVSIWFVAGAAAALIAAFLGAAVWLQVIIFVVVSAALLAILYPRLKHLVVRSNQATNADMVIGETCVVTRRIDNVSESGAVSAGGKTWTARSLHGEIIEEGELVRAEEIRGVKLYVSPLPKT